jgi:hypothetical protein
MTLRVIAVGWMFMHSTYREGRDGAVGVATDYGLDGQGCQPYAPATLYPPVSFLRFLVLISVRG